MFLELLPADNLLKREFWPKTGQQRLFRDGSYELQAYGHAGSSFCNNLVWFGFLMFFNFAGFGAGVIDDCDTDEDDTG